MTTQKFLQPRCFSRKNIDTPTAVVLSATGHLKPCNYYAAQSHMRDLREWAEKHNLDWENDLDICNGAQAVYASETWQRLIKELESGNLDVPKTCIEECSKEHQPNDE